MVCVWDVGYDINKVYKEILKPSSDNVFICGGLILRNRVGLKVPWKKSYDVIKLLPFNNIKISVKKKKLKKKKDFMTIEEVIKHGKLIVLDHDGNKPIYDISKWIPKRPGGSIIKTVGIDLIILP